MLSESFFPEIPLSEGVSHFEREPSSECVIRFRDCDPFGHLHNSRYADYLFDAREDHLRSCYSIDLHEYARERHLGWVVTSAKTAFFSPARVSERVRIFTRLLSFTQTHLHVEARMYGTRKGDLKAFTWWSLRVVDPQIGATREHDAEFMELCERLVNAPALPITFEHRLETVPRRMES